MATPSDTSASPARAWLLGGLALAVLAALATLAQGWLAARLGARIERNQNAWITQRLDALVPAELHDNDLLADTIAVQQPDLLGTARPVTVYRARKAGEPVAVILRPIAPDGYQGPIELLVAIAYDGSLLGVQVLRHHETPGLGSQFESNDGAWLRRFSGLSLQRPPQQRWTVRKDGGEFDAFTGATITPRAIVKAVRSTLEYYRSHRDRLFAAPAQAGP